MKFSINKSVLEKYPNIVEYVVIVKDFDNEKDESGAAKF